MKKLAETIHSIVEKEASTHGAFVVGMSSGEKGLYRYYVDSAEQLTMNLLAEITRNVSRQIDEFELGEEAFVFEVSSPGADNPLTDIRQFQKHIGRTFELETTLGIWEGKLTGVEGDAMHFDKTTTEKVGNKKQTTTESVHLPFNQIIKATIKISFK